MSTLDKLKEEYEKNVQSEEQVRQLSEQLMQLYMQASAIPELQQKPHDILNMIVERNFPSAQKNIEFVKKECEQFMLRPSPAKQEQEENVVGPFFSKSAAAFFQGYESNEPSTTQTLAASPAA